MPTLLEKTGNCFLWKTVLFLYYWSCTVVTVPATEPNVVLGLHEMLVSFFNINAVHVGVLSFRQSALFSLLLSVL